MSILAKLRLKNIEKAFKGKTVFEHVNVEVEKGTMIAIKGKSGVGKSTLLNIIAGLERPSSGQYYLNNRKMHDRTLSELAEIRSEFLGYISQHSPMIPNLNAIENICVPLWLKKERPAVHEQKIRQALEWSKDFEIDQLLDKKISKLSGGEIQRVGIIRSLIHNPELLIADEPTGALDDETTAIVMNRFKALTNEGLTIIIATHSHEVASYCDQLFNLTEDGLFLS